MEPDPRPQPADRRRRPFLHPRVGGHGNCCADRMQLCVAAQDTVLVEPFIDIRALLDPLCWRAPRTALACSITDLFHEGTPGRFIELVFAVIAAGKASPPFCAAWLRVSVEDRARRDRTTEILRRTPSAERFLSLEPLLGDPGDFDLGARLQGGRWTDVSGRDAAGWAIGMMLARTAARMQDPADPSSELPTPHKLCGKRTVGGG